jgi:hypothetical protein
MERKHTLTNREKRRSKPDRYLKENTDFGRKEEHTLTDRAEG